MNNIIYKNRGVIYISFLYIINKEKYLKYYKIGFKKYLPTFMISKFKTKIIDTVEIEDKIAGKIVGINLKDINFEIQKDINEYLKSIKNIIDLDLDNVYDNLYIEGQEDMDDEVIRYIEEEVALNIDSGNSNRIEYLPEMIENIFKALKEDPYEKELLIIGEDLDIIKDVAIKMSDKFKFISIYGMDEDKNEDLYDSILESKGISIFSPTDLSKVIRSYSVIINLSDFVFNESNYRRAKKSAIIFDFCNKNKKLDTIHDFTYKIKNLKGEEGNYFDKGINSSLCECFKATVGEDYIIPKNIISKGKVYRIQEYIELYLKSKGKF